MEIKATVKRGGAVDTHGARDQCMCVFVYETDKKTEPAINRAPMRFVEVYIGAVTEADFRRNERSLLGTRTATVAREAIKRFRSNWVYMIK